MRCGVLNRGCCQHFNVGAPSLRRRCHLVDVASSRRGAARCAVLLQSSKLKCYPRVFAASALVGRSAGRWSVGRRRRVVSFAAIESSRVGRSAVKNVSNAYTQITNETIKLMKKAVGLCKAPAPIEHSYRQTCKNNEHQKAKMSSETPYACAGRRVCLDSGKQ